MSKFILFFFSISAFAQVDVFKREFDFVSSQRQTLEKQLVQIKEQRSKTGTDLNSKLDKLHLEKARLQAELEGLDNEVATFSLLAKKQLQSESALIDRLNWTKQKNEEMKYFLPRDIQASKESFVSLLDQQAQVLESLSQVFKSQKSFLDNNQSLTSGEVFHLGPFARYLEKNNRWSVLVLSESGYYSASTETSFDKAALDAPTSMAAFIQLPFSKSQVILKEKNVFNRILDLIPGFFLALIFLAIGWIFIQLAKS